VGSGEILEYAKDDEVVEILYETHARRDVLNVTREPKTGKLVLEAHD